MANEAHPLENLLTESGFKKASAQQFVLEDVISQATQWKLDDLIIHYGHDYIKVSKLSVSIDLTEMFNSLSKVLVGKYEEIRSIEVVEIDNAYWLLVGFSPIEGEKSLLNGLFVDQYGSVDGCIGFKISLQSYISNISLSLTDMFFVGSVPHRLFFDFSYIIEEAFGVSVDRENSSMHEYRIPLMSLIATINPDLSEIIALCDTFEMDQIRVDFQHGAARFSFDKLGDYFQSPNLPFEVMEDRESGAEVRRLDYDIALNNSPNLDYSRDLPLVLRRRAALLDSSDGTNINQVDVESWLEREPDFKLYLSVAFSYGLSGKDKLAHLTKLSDVLIHDMGLIDDSRSLVTALSEAFGDAWRLIDLEKAVKSYDYILKDRPDLVRVLIKKHHCLQEIGDFQPEIENLERIISQLSEPRGLAYCYSRLNECLEDIDIERAIEAGKRSLHWDRSGYKVGLRLSGQLEGEGRFFEAIHVLDNLSRSLKSNSHDAEIVQVDMAIARIWFDCLGRPDMAVKRALKIIREEREVDGAAIWVLDLLLDYGAIGEKIIGLEYFLPGILARGNNKQYLDKLNILAPLYEENSDDIEKLARFYEAYMEEFSLSLDDVERLYANGRIPLDWLKVLNRLEALNNSEDSPRFNRLLASIYEEKIEDPEKALNFRLNLLQNDSTPIDEFMEILRVMIQQQRFHEVYGYLDNRKSLGRNEEKLEILRTLVRIGDHLSISEASSSAIDLMILDHNNDSALRRVLDRIDLDEDMFAIRNLAENVKRKIEDITTVEYWFDYFMNLVEAADSPDKYRVLDWLYETSFSIFFDQVGLIERALGNIAKGPPDVLAKYLLKALDLGAEISISTGLVEGLLGNSPVNMARYYLNQSYQETERDNRILYLEKAVALLADMQKRPDVLQKSLVDLSALRPLKESEIQLLQLCVLSLNSWQETKNIFINYVQGDFSELACQFLLEYWDNFDLPPTQVLEFHRARIANHPKDILFTFDLVAFVINNFDVEEGIVHVVHVLDLDESWKFPNKMEHFLQWLFNFQGDDDVVKEAVRNKVEGFFDSNESLFLMYEDIVWGLGSLHKSLVWKAFRLLMARGDKDRALEAWCRMTTILLDQRQARSLLDDTVDYLLSIGSTDSIFYLLKELFQENTSQNLAFGVLNELKIFYALRCIDESRDLDEAFVLIKDMFENRPEEFRLWVPLYFCYKEERDEVKLTDFLDEIMPRLRRNPSILHGQPITLAGLESEYLKLRSPAGERSHQYGQSELDTSDYSKSSQTSTSNEQGEVNHLVSPFQKAAEEAPDMGFRTQFTEESNLIEKLPHLIRNSIVEGENHDFASSSEGFTFSEKGIDESILGQFNQLENVGNHGYTGNLVGDWKATVRNLHYAPNMTREILGRGFNNELERHLAAQCFAIISGEINDLDDHNMKVWRDFDGGYYPFTLEGRLTNRMRHPLMNSSFYKLIALLHKVITKKFEGRLSISHIAKKVSIHPEKVIDIRKPIKWTDSFFAQRGFRSYAEVLGGKKITVFSLSGLKGKIYFDYPNRALYFDANFYGNKPSSFLIHRVLIVFRAISSGLYPLIRLSPESHLMPFLEEVRKIAAKKTQTGGIELPKLRLGGNETEGLLSRVDLMRLDALFSQVGFVSAVRIKKLREVVWVHLYLLQTLETLDLVGVSEAILGREIAGKRLEPKELLKQSKIIGKVMEKVIQIKF